MIRASLVQMEVIPLSARENMSRIAAFVEAEADAGSNLIVFPELSNTGYVEPLIPGGAFVSDVSDYTVALQLASADISGGEIAALVEICAKRGVHVVVGLSLRDPSMAGVLRNSSVLIGPEGVLRQYDKVHLWHNEKLYYARGTRIDSQALGDTRLGMQICYDSRFPEITRVYAIQGAQVVTNIWASFGKDGEPVSDEGMFIHRAYMRAIENGIFYLSCNRAGKHGDFRFYGRSCAIAPQGRILGALDHDREDVLRVELDLSLVAAYRAYSGIWSDRAPDVYLGSTPASGTV